MEGDPFSAFASFIDNPNSKSENLIMRRGEVLKVNPLEIDVGGITASGDELQVNASMLEQSETIVPVNPEQSSFEAKVTPKLSPGDNVLLLTTDDQVFYVLCKVVSI